MQRLLMCCFLVLAGTGGRAETAPPVAPFSPASSPAAAASEPAVPAAASAPDAPGNEADALQLADSAPPPDQVSKAWHGFAEYGYARTHNHDGSQIANQRLSFDLEWSGALAPGWRAGFSDRLDLNTQPQSQGLRNLNTLKEAFVGWRIGERWLADTGRINIRYGVGLGYNPTDFMRGNALRSVVSVDPITLRTNRMGSAVLRNQWLWDTGSATLVYAPQITTPPRTSTWDTAFPLTNPEDRVLVAVGNRFSDNFNPQFLLFKERGRALQAGANLSVLMGNAWIGFMEWSGGNNRSLLAQGAGQPTAEPFRNRWVTGLTYSGANRLTVSGELQYNGTGLERDQWAALGTSTVNYRRYRAYILGLQERHTRHSMFFSARWQDALGERTDLVALSRVNLDDHSALGWLEVVHRFDKADVAGQLQRRHGSPISEHGGIAESWAWQLVLRQHF